MNVHVCEYNNHFYAFTCKRTKYIMINPHLPVLTCSAGQRNVSVFIIANTGRANVAVLPCTIGNLGSRTQ